MTHVEKIEAIVKSIEYHGIYTVERMQKLFDAAELPIKLSTSWKVTNAFIKDVKKSGGWCSIPLGTPITDGRAVLALLMNHYKVKNPESFMGNGRQFYSDLDVLRAEALRLDGEVQLATA